MRYAFLNLSNTSNNTQKLGRRKAFVKKIGASPYQAPAGQLSACVTRLWKVNQLTLRALPADGAAGSPVT